MTDGATRRDVLRLAGAAAGASLLPGFAFAEPEGRRHGMAVIGDLKYGPDFRHFDYVNPDAPRGGRIVTQLSSWGYNQNPNTFNTLNIYVLRGDGAAGMPLTFASLMAGSADEPGSVYGLVAREVERSEDGKSLRFFLRPEAAFHDGSPITAEDVAFSLQVLRDEGHPNIALELKGLTAIEVEDERTIAVRLAAESGRSLPIMVATAPIFSQSWWAGRTFGASLSEPPLGSGPYRVAAFALGNAIEFERVRPWWADDLPVMRGRYNFDRIRYEYYRDRTTSFEAFKKGQLTFREEFTSRIWARDYDFPARLDGRVVRDEVPSGSPSGAQGWFINMRRPKFSDPRVRLALAHAFDFEWTNQNIMFGSYQRTHSFFENSELKAEGAPGPAELALLEPFRGKVPDEVFGAAAVPPVSDGSGRDRRNLQRANELLMEAGCTRGPNGLLTPQGEPFTVEFLGNDSTFEPHHNAYINGLRLLGIRGSYRIVDPAQYNERLKRFDFDMVVSRFRTSLYPDEGIRQFFSSERAKQEGSYNLAGVASPAVDALVEAMIGSEDWESFVTSARALDRVLRAEHFWVPQWFKPVHWFAYWDMYERPANTARYDPGVLDTWWQAADKAAALGKA
ncbi:extracellular solute-binding protein [Faunimonas sp. B44]|uniref:extracellular solute-binding protein n=1 Tax=Faunimonas sp. B44 TaxID=3461493 RepID=UPI0040447B33